MSHSFLDDDRFLISGRTDDYRAFLVSRGPQAVPHRSLETEIKRLAVHARRIATKTGKAVGGFMHRWMVAVCESKMRRVQHELALQGIHYSYDELSKSDAKK